MGLLLFCLMVLYVLEGSCICLVVQLILMGLLLSCLTVLYVLEGSCIRLVVLLILICL